MKNIFLSALAAVSILLASCSKDPLAGESSGDQGLVTFTTQLEGAPVSRAIGDGMTATNLSYAVYVAGQTAPIITSEDQVTLTGGQASVSLHLAKGKVYEVLFWADAPSSPYSIDWATKTVTVNYAGAEANDESRDAFFHSEKGLTVTGPVTKTIKLKRPFAQLNIGTNDMAAAQTAGIATANIQTKVIVKKLSNQLNLSTGVVSGTAADVTFARSDKPTGAFTVTGKGSYDYLSMNYLLVGADKQLVACDFAWTDGVVTTANQMELTNVPVQRNYRTNIHGSLLTNSADFNVIVEPGFGGDHDYEELYIGAKLGGRVKLTGNVVLTADMEKLIVAAGKTLTVDLNGYSIESQGDGKDAFYVLGTLIINGDGEVKATYNGPERTGNYAVWADGANARVTINGGTYLGYGSCVYSKAGAKIEINAGRFKVDPNSDVSIESGYTVLNIQDNSAGSIIVRGGTYLNYDPAKGDNSVTGDSFLAEGYASVKVSADPAPMGTFEVVKSHVFNGVEFVNAANKGVENIKLTGDVAFDASALAIPTGKTITVDMNGHTLVRSAGSDALTVTGGTLSVDDNDKITVDRSVVENNGTTIAELVVKGGARVNNRGTVTSIDVTDGTVYNYAVGTITGGTVGAAGEVLHEASDAASLRTRMTVTPYSKLANGGVFLTADISDVFATPIGSQDDQDVFRVGNAPSTPAYNGYVVDGNGHTLSGVGYNNVFAVYANDVTVRNLTVLQTAEQKAIRGNNCIMVYKATGVKLVNVTLKDSGRYGVIVNGSEVTVEGIATSGNGWGGINVAQGSGMTEIPHLTVLDTAPYSFGEPAAVVIDLRTVTVTVDDYDTYVTVPAGWTAVSPAANVIVVNPGA